MKLSNKNSVQPTVNPSEPSPEEKALAEKKQKRIRRLILAGVLVLCFVGSFFLGKALAKRPDKKDESGNVMFTDADYAGIRAQIQSQFSEEIDYVTNEPSGPHYTLTGVPYNDVSFLVCVPSSDDVTVFIYYKYLADGEGCQKGDVVCGYVGVSSTYKKSDIFPE